MSVIEFTIPGRVGGKGRGRAFAYRSKHTGQMQIGVHTPERTRSTEALVRSLASDAMGERPLLEGPVRLRVTVWLNRTASWSKKRKAAAVWVTGKPDTDNTIKLLADSMNRIVWGDDSQIADLAFVRLYTDGPERVVVSVSALTQELPRARDEAFVEARLPL